MIGLLAVAHQLQHLLQFRLGRPAVGAVAGQVHRRVPVGHDNLVRLHVLGHIDDDGAGPAGGGDVERLLEDAHDVLGALDQVVVLGDGPADFDDGRLLEGVAADDRRADLPGDGDDGAGVELGVGEGGDEVGGAGTAGGDADADPAGGAGVALGREAAALFVARQDGAQAVGDVGERLVDRHTGAAGVGENDLDAVVEQALDQDIGPGHRRLRRLAHGGNSHASGNADGRMSYFKDRSDSFQRLWRERDARRLPRVHEDVRLGTALLTYLHSRRSVRGRRRSRRTRPGRMCWNRTPPGRNRTALTATARPAPTPCGR